jgi:hypothetical protein
MACRGAAADAVSSRPRPTGMTPPARPDRPKELSGRAGSADAASGTRGSTPAGRKKNGEAGDRERQRTACGATRLLRVRSRDDDWAPPYLLYDQMRAGKLAYLKVGRRRIITRQHLEAFLTQEVS